MAAVRSELIERLIHDAGWHLPYYDFTVLVLLAIYTLYSGPGSVVVIATAYGPNGPGIRSRLGRDFPHLSRPALRPTQPPVQWVPGLSRG
jgi:hypothetical protein